MAAFHLQCDIIFNEPVRKQRVQGQGRINRKHDGVVKNPDPRTAYKNSDPSEHFLQDNQVMGEYLIREVRESDLDRCFEIESVAYEGDEAATREKIRKRIRDYPEGFLVLEVNNEIAGFINIGATDDVQLSDERFKEMIGHDSNGKHVVIMSVVIHPDFQGKGLAAGLMNRFVHKMRGLDKSMIHLICRARLIDMYRRFGFVYIRESGSDHGGMKWHEMSMSLNAAT